MYTFPCPSTAKGDGSQNKAAEPFPSGSPRALLRRNGNCSSLFLSTFLFAVADPATVTTSWAANPPLEGPGSLIILRRTLFVLSATKIFPVVGSHPTPAGWLNVARVGVPSRFPTAPLPAMVVTSPSGCTRLIRWLCVSETMAEPSHRSAVIQKYSPKIAFVPLPSWNCLMFIPCQRGNGSLRPAMVVTSPFTVSTRRIRLHSVSATRIPPLPS
mmetsp:Transcript_5975/g.9286  ORF Transcript_5975/g.9286 Transcript_5975/m.9286 type:complete len:214 (-) Transcript_5975:1229-1870(-)